MRRLCTVLARTYIAPDLLNPETKLKTSEQLKEKKDAKKNQIKLLTNLLHKKIDIEQFEANVLEKQRIVIEPIRLRHSLDSLRYLRSRQEVAAVIKPRGDEPAIYFIIHNDQVRTLSKQNQITSRPVYIKLNDELIRCTLHDLRRAVDNTWYTKVYFNRYVVGEPNEIKVELGMEQIPHERLDKKKIEWNMKSVLLLSYKDVYPPKINIDFMKLIRKGKFSFGDLLNQLPEGLELHPKFTRNLNFPIAFLDDYYSKREQDVLYLQEKWDYVNKELTKKIKGISEDEEMPRFIELYTDENKKIEKKNKTRSIKKLLKGEQDKLRAEIEKITLEAGGADPKDAKGTPKKSK